MSNSGTILRIVDIENGATVMYIGDRLIAQGSRKMCESIRDGKLPEYIEECEEERRRLGLGLHSARAKRQLAAEAAAAAMPKEQTDLFA